MRVATNQRMKEISQKKKMSMLEAKRANLKVLLPHWVNQACRVEKTIKKWLPNQTKLYKWMNLLKKQKSKSIKSKKI